MCGYNPARVKGFRAERELVRKFWEKGFAAIRAPASGSKVKHAIYPDVVAIYKGKIFIFEVKARRKLSTIYISEKQVEKLKEFARRAYAEPYIALKIQELKRWFFISLSKLKRVGSKYRIDLEVIKDALTFEKFVESVKSVTLAQYIRSDG